MLGQRLLKIRRCPGLTSQEAAGLIGVGGLLLPFEWGLWIGAAMLAALFVMVLVVIGMHSSFQDHNKFPHIAGHMECDRRSGSSATLRLK